MFTYYICVMELNEIWEEIIAKPKWYAGIKNELGTFYSVQNAWLLKQRFAEGTLSEPVLERILNSHGYILVKTWVKKDAL